MGIKCFLLEPTGKVERRLRRYVSSMEEGTKCPGNSSAYSYHNASAEALYDIVEADGPDDIGRNLNAESAQAFSGWPTKCAACDYHFLTIDEWQVSTDHIFKRADTGEEFTLRSAPPGAMWDAYWFAKYDGDWVGPDGKSITVRCPNGVEWNIDSRARNCDSPCENCGVAYRDHNYEKCPGYKDAKPHKCWIRSGDPPMLTVSKDGAPTCGAGAGSIQAGDYHGFLRNGEFDP
jgi:hypothetical protein